MQAYEREKAQNNDGEKMSYMRNKYQNQLNKNLRLFQTDLQAKLNNRMSVNVTHIRWYGAPLQRILVTYVKLLCAKIKW